MYVAKGAHRAHAGELEAAKIEGTMELWWSGFLEESKGLAYTESGRIFSVHPALR